MTGLLVAAAIVAALTLVVSAARTGADATAADLNRRGNWGIVERTPDRSRDLNPHQRRWQTALLSGRTNRSRWKDVAAEIDELGRQCGVAPDASPPSSLDHAWIEERLAVLEQAVEPPSPDTAARESTR